MSDSASIPTDPLCTGNQLLWQRKSVSVLGMNCLREQGRLGLPSKPSLEAPVLAVVPFVFQGKSEFQKCLGKRLEVPDVLLPDIRGPRPSESLSVPSTAK